MTSTGLYLGLIFGTLASAASGWAIGWRSSTPRAQRSRRVPRLLRASVLVVASLGLTAGVGQLSRVSLVRRVDEGILRDVLATRSPGLSRLMLDVTEVGNTTGTAVALALVVAAVAAHRRQYLFPVVSFVAFFLCVRIQRFVDKIDLRPKPSLATAIGPVGGFPSGGTARTLLVAGIIAALLAPYLGRRRVRAGLGAVVALLAWIELASRLILGRHWVLDVVGGCVLGGLLLAAAVPFLDVPVPGDQAARRSRSSRPA